MADVIRPVGSLEEWFADRLKGLSVWYSPELLAYVAGVLGTRRWDENDMSQASLVLAYQDAVALQDFSSYQRIGDWVLFVEATHPKHLGAFREVAEALAQRSYYTCHRIMQGRWRLYEELADCLPVLARRVQKRLP